MTLGGYYAKMTDRKFPTHDEICKYYESYMMKHELHDLVEWETKVERTEKKGTKWLVSYRNLQSNQVSCDEFDYIMICVGKLWDPQYPAWALQRPSYSNVEVLHSRDYRIPENFAGKRVCVAGIGNSALDISLELACSPDVKKPIYVSCRRGVTILPIDDANGNPLDSIFTSRAFQYLASPSARIALMSRFAIPINKEFRKYGLPLPPDPDELFSTNNPVSNLKDSRRYLDCLRKGLIRFIPGVTGFGDDPSTLRFQGEENNHLEDIDSAIFCTGYRTGLDFLEPSVREQIVEKCTQKNGYQPEYMQLYKNVLNPYDDTMGVLVFLTSYGNESILGQMQARWLTKYWSDDKFKAQVWGEKHRKKFFERSKPMKKKFIQESNTPNAFFVRYLPYMDELARDLGVLPDLGRILSEKRFKLAFQLVFGPSQADQYFLLEEGANETSAWSRDAIQFFASL